MFTVSIIWFYLDSPREGGVQTLVAARIELCKAVYAWQSKAAIQHLEVHVIFSCHDRQQRWQDDMLENRHFSSTPSCSPKTEINGECKPDLQCICSQT